MKKLLSMILAFAMVIAIIPCSAMADGDTVISITAGPGYQSGVNHTGMVVTPEITVTSGTQPAGYKYQWYAQNGNSTEYILPWETGASITINSQIPAGWWLNFEATPLDSEGNAIGGSVKSNHYISTYPMKGSTDYPSITSEQSAAYRNTPSEYIFEVDGVKFILLDRVWSGEYYVMMEESVGKRQFDTSGATGKKFSPTSETNIAHWLNSTESGNFLDGTYLPSSVQNHITEEAWTFEGDGNWGGDSRTLKVGLLSYSEYLAYFGRFGLWLSAYNSADPTGWEGWWLRTLHNNEKVFASFKNGGNQNGTSPMGKLNRVNATDTNYHVRPTFRLSADFFAVTRIDLSKAGEKVKDVIADYSLSVLENNIYTENELIESGIIKKPEIRAFSVEGNFAVGDTVKCSYEWFSKSNVAEGASIFGFSLSDAKDGPYIDICPDSKEYTISADDMGKYISFYVTPYDMNGISGELYRTEPVQIQEKASTIVTSLSRSGQTISITLKNLTEGEAQVVTVMASVFDAENKLTGCYARKVSVPAAGTVTLDNLSIGTDPVSRVSVMVWDSLESMKSIFLSDK